MVGIVAYGTYIPRFRVRIADVASFWKKPLVDVEGGNIKEKAVAGADEDAVTMAAEAAWNALPSFLKKSEVGALLVGSESHPYAVKPTSSIVGEILGLSNNYLALDTQFACKAGTAAMQLVAAMVSDGRIKYGIAVGSDAAQAKPGDPLEFSAGSAAAAFVFGRKPQIAKILDFTSYTSDTPDFWRRDGQSFPSHGGRFTGEPAYFAHVLGASKKLLAQMNTKMSDFSYVVFHMPNCKFPTRVGKILGVSQEQLAPGFVVDTIGNPYSASSLVGLAAVLDVAKPKEKIFVCSYGSGAGSDAFAMEVTSEIEQYRKKSRSSVKEQIENKIYVDYATFAKILMGKDYI